MNSVTMTGRLTRDPETKQFQGGSSVVNVSIAVSNRKKVGDNYEDVPIFLRANVWGKRGEAIMRYLKKGDGINVTGALSVDEYQTKEGETKTSIGIDVRDWSFGAKSKANEAASPNQGQFSAPDTAPQGSFGGDPTPF